MGIFKQKKQSPIDEAIDRAEHVFDESFREELRKNGRLYFEKLIEKNASLFKAELDATVEGINVELKEHVIEQLHTTVAEVNFSLKEHATKQLDEQFAQYGKMMKDAQDLAIQSITRSAQTVQDQHQKLAELIEKNVASQGVALDESLENSKKQIAAMKDVQDSAMKSLADSAQAIEEQRQKLSLTLEKNITNQEDMLITAFESNMAQIVEHYLLGALGDQYDLKAQLPSIIKQMEANKDVIVEDMKL